MFIAYTVRRNKLVETVAHSTRDEAARELFTKFPKLKSCSTAVAYKNGDSVWTTCGQDIRSINKRDLPPRKMTKAEALALISDLYTAFNTADHENKADWMTRDLAGDRGCALIDTMLTSKAFTAEDRAKFYDSH